MSPDDLVALAIPLTWLAFMALEAAFPNHEWPRIRGWRAQGVAFFLVVMTLNAALPGLFPGTWRAHALLPLDGLGTAGGVVVAYLALTLCTALLHRAYHRYDLLWRWVHQLHHAPQRMDEVGAVVFTPWEIVLNVIVFQLVITGLFGLAPLPAAIVGYVSVFAGLFQHLDVRTPRWVGWILQRPESHCVHHRRGAHSFNYSDVAIWDLMMGTCRNPRRFQGEVGFEGPSALPLKAALTGRDANAALYGPGNRGSSAPATNPA